MPTKNFFWLGAYIFEPGTIIHPGNWGRIVSQYNSQNNIYVYLREKIFEEVRLKKYPTRPSRMKSIFLCKSIKDLKEFQKSENRPFDLPYEVKLLDKTKTFEADWTMTNFPNAPFPLTLINENANKYWEGEELKNIEVLAESRIQIIKKI